MREPYGKAVAPRTSPTPWRCVRKGVLQALAGVRGGWALSRDKELRLTALWHHVCNGDRLLKEYYALKSHVYLHYAFDLWAHQWRQTQAHGDVIVVRYAVPHTYPWLKAFRRHVMWQWWWMLRRRGNKRKTKWSQVYRLAARWLPPPRILHPYPAQRLAVTTQGSHVLYRAYRAGQSPISHDDSAEPIAPTGPHERCVE